MAYKVGDKHEAVVIEKVSRTHITKYAGASGDFNPLHHDDTAAQGLAGYPSVFAHGMLSMGLTGTMVTDWLGKGALKKANPLKSLVAGDRIELPTRGFSVPCSTD